MKAIVSALTRCAFLVGSLGLLGAMAVDFAAVIGRRSGVPLLGSIELSQVCIVCMASASLLGVTLDRGHATVHLLTERLAEGPKRAFARASDALSAVFFAFILGGSALLAFELWNGAEQSELLGVPIVPLRVIFCASLAGIASCFIVRAVARKAAP
ncbi:MAG TPA: TRAP transporter small permease subunit [Polyangiales bacterium]|nr:TRAP transporter small permease subunit [Polyangiales bacterium]